MLTLCRQTMVKQYAPDRRMDRQWLNNRLPDLSMRAHNNLENKTKNVLLNTELRVAKMSRDLPYLSPTLLTKPSTLSGVHVFSPWISTNESQSSGMPASRAIY